jgi:hypothetical protein
VEPGQCDLAEHPLRDQLAAQRHAVGVVQLIADLHLHVAPQEIPGQFVEPLGACRPRLLQQQAAYACLRSLLSQPRHLRIEPVDDHDLRARAEQRFGGAEAGEPGLVGEALRHHGVRLEKAADGDTGHGLEELHAREDVRVPDSQEGDVHLAHGKVISCRLGARTVAMTPVVCSRSITVACLPGRVRPPHMILMSWREPLKYPSQDLRPLK